LNLKGKKRTVSRPAYLERTAGGRKSKTQKKKLRPQDFSVRINSGYTSLPVGGKKDFGESEERGGGSQEGKPQGFGTTF